MAVHAIMTVLRVLPDDVYDQVVSSEGKIKPGARVSGDGEEKATGHEGHEMHGEMDMKMDMTKRHDMHSQPKAPIANPSSAEHHRHDH